MVNASVDKGLSIFTADNKWLSFDYPPLSHVQVNQLLITKNNQKWINIYRTEKTGIFVLNDNNTIDNAADDQYAFSGRFVDQQGTDVGATAYLCLAEDQNGLVWVGTNNGPISFSSADQVGRGQCNRVIAMDENGLNGYHLLEGQTITAIAVDGGNRKWMGTRDNGVFVVDQSDGVLTVENFNTDNSSILSNNITAITIDGETGEVYIATSQGLCSYRGEAIDGKPDFSTVYAYPNPVYPARQSQVVVTGLMQRSTVKITDMAGNLIREGISNGGQFTWNCADSRGNTVKAGIYLVFVSNPDGSSGEVTKIMVIR
ncbi:MAG: T9SS type A sorting domain-containing protein [Candidatus Symbiothrix sp.]|nr:T9SS type A sorting domain-containing protein [Candidatus Symbiothrix sp.]